MNGEEKLTAAHLSRRAVVYLRQSSEGQVRNNLESQRLQYAMASRARELGFSEVEVIDVDLGASAAVAAKRREGFERLLAAVALREVGLILSRELSRLLRTDKDFCQLIELCQVFDTLIGDEYNIWDVTRMDDQLVLGIKATMSVVELKVLRMRLVEGKENPPGKLSFIVHWKGGSHTALEMVKVSAKTASRTAEENLDVIRKMAPRYGDNVIAAVLNKLGRQTGKGKPWSQLAVKTARRNHGIEGRARTIKDPEVLTLQEAIRYTDTSDTTIRKLVDGGVLRMRQVVPFAPWEIQRSDLDSKRVRIILARLEQTGRVVLGDTSATQQKLFQ